MKTFRRILIVLLAVLATWMLANQFTCSQGYNATTGVREPARAGQWYAASEPALRKQIAACLAKADPKPRTAGRLIALVEPHAGYAFSGPTAAWGYKLLKRGEVKRVILLGPSHYVGFHGVSISAAKYYKTPLGLVPVDRTACDALLKEELFQSIERAHTQEHSLEAQIPFLQYQLGDTFKLVPIVVGSLRGDDFARIAKALSPYVDNETLIVISSDFTHYGPQFDYVPFRTDIPANLKKLDMGAVDEILKRDAAGFLKYQQKTGATICGRMAIAILLNMLPDDARGELLHYATSGAVLGDYSNSVSYVAISFRTQKKAVAAVAPGALTDKEKRALLELARKTLTAFVRDGKTLQFNAEDYPPTLRRKAGVFVTLTKKGRLRGCIGYVVGRVSILEGVRNNAINAAARDPRFEPVKPDELKDIEIEISVMTPLERIADPNKIVCGTHGILLKKGWHQGLLLPQVATEYGWNREQFLDATCQKAGLRPGDWRTAEIYSFSAQVFNEAQFKKHGEKDEQALE